MVWTRRRLLSAGAFAALIGGATSGLSQQRARPDLFVCEDCEGIFDGMPDPDALTNTSRIAPEGEPGEPLVLRGRVLEADGITPAAGVILYSHHTDIGGIYREREGETVWGRRHGVLHGWTRTGPDGAYEFRTIKPGQYPNLSQPAHIHLHALEPGSRPYWLDEVVFDGDPGVTDAFRQSRENRGGSGIVRLGRLRSGEWLAERDIILEPHPG